MKASRAKLIGYARFSTRQQSTDRQQADLLAADARRDGPFVDHGVSGGPRVATSVRTGTGRAGRGRHPRHHHSGPARRSTQNTFAFADALRTRAAAHWVLNLRGSDVDTSPVSQAAVRGLGVVLGHAVLVARIGPPCLSAVFVSSLKPDS